MSVPTVVIAAADARLADAARRAVTDSGLPTVAVAPPALAQQWRAAAAIVLDATAARGALGLPRRPGLVLVTAEPAAESLWQLAVGVGAEAVVELPADQAVLVERLHALDLADATASRRVVCCIAAHGGAGASTLAVALAVAAGRRGGSPVLIDGDAAGGGLDLLMGAEGAPGLRWPDLLDVPGAIAAPALTEAIVTTAGVALLSCDRRGLSTTFLDSAPGVLTAALRAGDVVVADLPRHLHPPPALAAAGTALLVVASGVRGTAAAVVAADTIRRSFGDVRLVVRAGRGNGLSPADVARAVGLPIAAVVPNEAAVTAAADDGSLVRQLPRVGLMRVAGQLLDALGAGVSTG